MRRTARYFHSFARLSAPLRMREPHTTSDKKGLYALEKADLFNLLCIPPFAPDEAVGAGDHARHRRRKSARGSAGGPWCWWTAVQQ